MRALVFVASTIGSMIGWWIGQSFGVFTAFALSMIGLALGVWWGRRVARQWSLH